jgi:hypothetical protein
MKYGRQGMAANGFCPSLLLPLARTEMEDRLQFHILPQPDDSTCGPTCLHAIYRYFGDQISLSQVIREASTLEGGGTLATMLGNHALLRGYRASLYTYNLIVFDPTWFGPGVNLLERLQKREQATGPGKQKLAIRNYMKFLDLGGQIRYEDLSRNLLRRFLRAGLPILTGLSSTHLYRSMRVTEDGQDDDIRGEVQGHFVVLSGYDHATHTVHVADPYSQNPLTGTNFYVTSMDRLINAILLGVITYDANLLVIEPPIGKKGLS